MYSEIKNSLKNVKYTQEYDDKITLVRNIIRDFGIPANFIGYKYIIEALLYMINSEKKLFLNEVYICLSDYHKTSIECVEASIRNAIKRATVWNSVNIKKTLNIPESVKLSNSVFLNCTKEIIIEKYKL